MNTYSKYEPNVFLAKCTEKHKKGELINVTTRYGKENESEVYNLIYEKDGFFYYSIVRADGFNIQERAKQKAKRYSSWAAAAENKSDSLAQRSIDMTSCIPMGQPILVGHHSERAHRNLLGKSWNMMGKSLEMNKKAESHESRAEYWAKKEKDINLSMPESLEFFEFKLEKAKEYHEGLKSGKYERIHSFSLTYAKKEVNELSKKLEIAKKLWS